MNEEEQYKRAIELWGLDLQFGMLSEECGELLTAVNQYRRGRKSEIDVLEEMADVTIMIRQVMVAMEMKGGKESLDIMIKSKLHKMGKLIRDSHNKRGKE